MVTNVNRLGARLTKTRTWTRERNLAVSKLEPSNMRRSVFARVKHRQS